MRLASYRSEMRIGASQLRNIARSLAAADVADILRTRAPGTKVMVEDESDDTPAEFSLLATNSMTSFDITNDALQVGSLTPSTDLTGITFTSGIDNIAISDAGIITLGEALDDGSHTITVLATYNNTSEETLITIGVSPPVELTAPDSAYTIATTYTGVLTPALSPTGGSDGGFTFTVSSDHISIDSDGVIDVTTAFAAGAYTIAVTVMDNTNNSMADIDITISVTPPVALANTTLTGSTNQTDGVIDTPLAPTGGSGSAVWTLSGETDGGNIDINNDGEMTITAGLAEGEYTLTVTVTDANGTSATAVVVLDIVENVALANVSLETYIGNTEILYDLDPRGLPDANGQYSYTETSNAIRIDDDGNIRFDTGAPQSAMTLAIEVVVTDSAQTTVSATVNIGITPAVAIASSQTYNTYSTFTGALETALAPTASGGRGVSYSFDETAHPNINIDDNGVVSINPALTTDTGVAVVVTDKINESTADIMLDINITPAVALTQPAAYNKADNFTGDLATLAPDANTGSGSHTWALGSGAPSNVSIGANTGIVAVNTEFATASTPYTVPVVVTDANGSTATANLIINISDAVQLAIPDNYNDNRATDFTGALVTLAPTNNTGSGSHSWDLGDNPPANIGIGNTGIITVSTALSADTYTVPVVVTDANGSSDTVDLNLIITPAVALADLTLTTNTSIDANTTIGTLAPSAGSGNYSFVYTSNSTLVDTDNTTADVIFSSAPDNTNDIIINVVVTDTTNGSSDTAIITVEVESFSLPVPSGVVDAAISDSWTYNAAATGGSDPDNISYTASVLDNNASGISIDPSSGIISVENNYWVSGTENIRIEVVATDNVNGTLDDGDDVPITAVLTINPTNRVEIRSGHATTHEVTAGTNHINIVLPTGSDAIRYRVNGANVSSMVANPVNTPPQMDATHITGSGSTGFWVIANPTPPRLAGNQYLLVYDVTSTNDSTSAVTRFTFTINVVTPDPLALDAATQSALDVGNFEVAADAALLSITVSGGTGDYTFSIAKDDSENALITGMGGMADVSDGVSVDGDGIITFDSDYYLDGNHSGNILIEVEISDAHEDVDAITATVTLTPSNRVEIRSGHATTHEVTAGTNHINIVLPTGSGAIRYRVNGANVSSMVANPVNTEPQMDVTHITGSGTTGFWVIANPTPPRLAGNQYLLVYDVTSTNDSTSAVTRFTFTINVTPKPVDMSVPEINFGESDGASNFATVIVSGGSGDIANYTYSIEDINGAGIHNSQNDAIIIDANNGQLSFANNYYLQGDVEIQVKVVDDKGDGDSSTNEMRTKTIPLTFTKRTKVLAIGDSIRNFCTDDSTVDIDNPTFATNTGTINTRILLSTEPNSAGATGDIRTNTNLGRVVSEPSGFGIVVYSLNYGTVLSQSGHYIAVQEGNPANISLSPSGSYPFEWEIKIPNYPTERIALTFAGVQITGHPPNCS